jgi:hypothetical protein
MDDSSPFKWRKMTYTPLMNISKHHKHAMSTRLQPCLKPRPVAATHSATGWDSARQAEHAIPAPGRAFTSLERSPEVFNWDPV